MRIAIIGGSLAGAFLALQLKDSEHQITIFDPRIPWEKPCGGAIHEDMFRQFPVLNELRCSWHRPSKLKFIPSTGEEDFLLSPQFAWLIVSRNDLNRAMLEVALRACAVNLTAERVKNISLTRDGSRWLVLTASNGQEFDAVVGADGANSIVRKKLIGPIPREHLAVTVGYMVSHGPLDEMIFKTYSDLMGFLWYFPRSDHVSVGIGGRVDAIPVPKLWRRLESFLNKSFPEVRKLNRWRALIPSVVKPKFWRQRCAGQNWALIGDAAGHVDPISGIGIPYALTSSNLLAQAILCGDLESYDRNWRDQYGNQLKQSSITMERFIKTRNTAAFEEEMKMGLLLNYLIAKSGAD